MRHLHRIIRKQKLFRKNKNVSSREILNSVAEELKERGFLMVTDLYIKKLE